MSEIQRNTTEISGERSKGSPFDGMPHRKALKLLINNGYSALARDFLDSSPTFNVAQPVRLIPENYISPEKGAKEDDVKSAVILQLVEVYGQHEHVRNSLAHYEIKKRKPVAAIEGDDSVHDRLAYRVPLPAQQVKLFHDINEGYATYMTMKKEEILPTDEQEVAFVKLVAAYTIMMQCNNGLVVSIAKTKPEYHHTHEKNLTAKDIIHYGFIGLSRAIVKFDVSLGWRFSTYAHHWIDQSMSRNIADFGRDIRIPVHVMGEVHAVRGYMDKQFRETGNMPTLADVSDKTGFNVERVRYLLRISAGTTSLNKELSTEDSRGDELIDFIISDSPGPDQLAYRGELASTIDTIMSNGVLNQEEKIVLRIRFRLERHLRPGEGAIEQSLTSIAKYMGLTKIDVRRIERQGLAKLVHRV